ncbi:hypothetical protein CVT26_009176 [Gymnopilus dilepis]|uniref:Uncharacterized protein n=1 Tax=Gymnopilus dilepis TaxID=231916 RepID=A0A409Y9V5_9AGAR|nr:hypothetical protein CVT26_009176 [Gymnopilus dilepis]
MTEKVQSCMCCGKVEHLKWEDENAHSERSARIALVQNPESLQQYDELLKMKECLEAVIHNGKHEEKQTEKGLVGGHEGLPASAAI